LDAIVLQEDSPYFFTDSYAMILMKGLPENSLLVGDRGFFSFEMLYEAHRRAFWVKEVVLPARLELARSYERKILSLVCLPLSPPYIFIAWCKGDAAGSNGMDNEEKQAY